MNIEILKKIGLTNGEIKTYLALLKIGCSSTGNIEKESQVSRSKLYGILDKLEKKGLVSYVIKNGVKQFQASDPNRIKEYIEEKEKDILNLKKKFENFLPQLEEYKKSKTESCVSVYQGLKGIMTTHERIYLKLKKDEEYVYLGIPKDQPTTHHLYWQRSFIKSVRLGIKSRMLFNKDTSEDILINRNSYELTESRYLSTNIKTPAYFLIYKDTVVITIASEFPISVEIINTEIAKAFFAYFEEFWKRSKPFKKEKEKRKKEINR